MAERLNVIGEQVRKAGLGLAYHNHEFEFIDHNGQTGYDILIRDTDPDLVKLQLDLFWSTHSAPLSAHELFQRQPGRIDFTKIMPDAALAGLQYYYVEQGDHFAVNPLQSVATSAAYVKKYLV